MTDLNKNKKRKYVCLSGAFLKSSPVLPSVVKKGLFLVSFSVRGRKKVLDQGGKTFGGLSRSRSVSFLHVQQSRLES